MWTEKADQDLIKGTTESSHSQAGRQEGVAGRIAQARAGRGNAWAGKANPDLIRGPKVLRPRAQVSPRKGSDRQERVAGRIAPGKDGRWHVTLWVGKADPDLIRGPYVLRPRGSSQSQAGQ